MIHKFIPWFVTISNLCMMTIVVIETDWSNLFVSMIVIGMGISSAIIAIGYFKIYAIFERMLDK